MGQGTLLWEVEIKSNADFPALGCAKATRQGFGASVLPCASG